MARRAHFSPSGHALPRRYGLPSAFAAAPILPKPFSQEQLPDTATNLVRPRDNVVKLKK